VCVCVCVKMLVDCWDWTHIPSTARYLSTCFLTYVPGYLPCFVWKGNSLNGWIWCILYIAVAVATDDAVLRSKDYYVMYVLSLPCCSKTHFMTQTMLESTWDSRLMVDCLIWDISKPQPRSHRLLICELLFAILTQTLEHTLRNSQTALPMPPNTSVLRSAWRRQKWCCSLVHTSQTRYTCQWHCAIHVVNKFCYFGSVFSQNVEINHPARQCWQCSRLDSRASGRNAWAHKLQSTQL